MRFPLLISFVGGLASATGFAPLSLWPVTLLALALLMHLVERAPTMRRALLLGWLFGVGHFTVGLNWIAHAFTFQDAMPHWFGYPAVALLALYLAVYPAAAAGLAWRWGRGHAAAFALIFAAAWIVTEWLRATMFTGFAWNPLSVVFVETPFSFGAGWIGTYALSGIAVMLSGTVMALLRRQFRTAAWLAVGPEWALLAGVLTLVSASPRERPGSPLIRVVQPNIGTLEKYDPAFDAINLGKLANLTVRTKPDATPRLILWPEGAIPEPPFLEEEAYARARLAAVLAPRDILLTGGTKRHRVRQQRGNVVEEYTIGGRNSTYALGARGQLLWRYDKAHLVPYGEYLPMRELLTPIGLSRLIPGEIDFWPGPGPLSFPLPGFGTVGVQTCYEIIFSGQVVDRANRPDFVFNPSNDAWFGDWGPPQHLAQARLRAIEEGLPVIRSTPTGISAVIDADGRLLATVPHKTAGFIETRLPPPHAPTLFARFGNILAFAAAIILAALGVALRRRVG